MFLWLKAFHIISVVCWFAVLFYLPRLFVYHAQAEDNIGKERFKIMERKLLRGIGNPSMIATLLFGGLLAWQNWAYYHTQTWFWVKLVLVSMLVVYHHLCARHYKNFRDDKPTPSSVYFRWFNEVPALLLIGIVVLVVVKQPM